MPTSPFSTVFCAPDRQELLALLSTAPEQWQHARLLKQNRGTTVTLVTLPTGAVVVKRHCVRTWRHWGDALLHGSAARRAWHGARLLQEHGFPVPRPLAVLEKRAGSIVQESLYCSAGLLTQVPLSIYWRAQRPHWSLRQRRVFLHALAGFLRAFHAAGLYAGDMRDENLLVEATEDDHWMFYLVDLDRIIRRARLGQRHRLKNLVQLDRTLGRSASASDRLFFLYQYLGTPLPPRSLRRALLRRLFRVRDRKDREYARRRVQQRAALARAARTAATLPPLDASPPHGLFITRALISCCIVCFNEEANIRRCLESVKWCDEIIVVDSFSTDRTVEICRAYTAHIIQRAWPGYVEQKRFALAQATHEWVLNVDADEEVSPELRHEIIGVLQRNDAAVDGFYVPRLVYYLGYWWWRGWYPGYRLRLFRKAKVRWGGVNPHEKVELLHGQGDRLRGDLYHYTYKDISDHLRTLNRLTDVASREHALRAKRIRVSDLLLRPLWRFLRFYVVRGTFRNGVPGLFVAATSAFYVFLKYAKLWEYTVRHHDAQAQHSPCRPREELGRGGGPGVGTHPVSPPLGSSLHRSR